MTTVNTARPPLRIALLNMEHQFTGIDEIFFMLTDSLERMGAVVNRKPTLESVTRAENDVLLIIGSPPAYPGLLTALEQLRRDPKRRLPVLFWHFEPLPDLETPLPQLYLQMFRAWLDAQRKGKYGMSRGGHFLLLKQAMQRKLFDKLFVFTQRKEALLQRHGIRATYLPMSYHPIFGSPTTLQKDRDIDVIFLGQMYDNRRGRVVQQIKEALEKEGIHLTLLEEVAPGGGLWGEERTALLNRVKINLSIYQHPLDGNGMRFSIGFGCGTVVVSEPVVDAEPFITGTHFIQGEISEIPRLIQEALKEDERRQQMCDAAFATMLSDFHLDTTARQLIEEGQKLADAASAI